MAHITMCELANGPRPNSRHQVNHHCDTPSCCNPDHLYWGTQSENMQDCVRRGRYRAHNAEKTHCSRGHELSGPNVIFRPTGGRRCATCHRRQKLASYYRCKKA
ncbi:HNH endonuclease signature motif containing protein [Lentzea sp. E54]|uniref:HNH endonuclease signature motif containing protein n=1 Tax=Lentzea xerophila TaxID=3435883 RepID=UPI003DA4FD83